MKRVTFFLLFTIVIMNVKAQHPADDTLYSVLLKDVYVKAKWKNDTDRYRYNQMKYYVTTILPYLDAATKLFKEVNTKLDEPGITKKEKKAFVNRKEDELREQFENRIKGLNETQGVLLVMLIARQTDLNIYKILQEFKNPLTAMKWQAWARLHGMNLDRRYHPEEEERLELIMYELGYPLPVSYVMDKR
ncbi:MAG: hypothetical protein K0Q79_1054 [Flavipsychrobacter sp.]|jgi:hypothetical protein|nr:hypothetical protein [Flavipsychrobacter sp.]